MEEARGCLVLDLKCLNVQEEESLSVRELDPGSQVRRLTLVYIEKSGMWLLVSTFIATRPVTLINVWELHSLMRLYGSCN